MGWREAVRVRSPRRVCGLERLLEERQRRGQPLVWWRGGVRGRGRRVTRGAERARGVVRRGRGRRRPAVGWGLVRAVGDVGGRGAGAVAVSVPGVVARPVLGGGVMRWSLGEWLGRVLLLLLLLLCWLLVGVLAGVPPAEVVGGGVVEKGGDVHGGGGGGREEGDGR